MQTPSDKFPFTSTQAARLRSDVAMAFVQKCALFVLLCAALIVGSVQVKANFFYDIPEAIKISATNTTLQPLNHYPSLLGSTEKSSLQLRPFAKWSSMFSRFQDQIETAQGQAEISKLRTQLGLLTDKPLLTQVKVVNALLNKQPYINDNRNWGQSDYWATPVEFLERGGDCEDYAIAKYVALRMLGVPEQRLRLAIVQDTWKNIPHAILIVYTDQGPYILDNQTKTIAYGGQAGRYRPIYSINRQAWWLHTPASQVQRTAAAY